MASKQIKGITIEINGDTSPLQNSLKDVDKASQATSKELGEINRALKFDSSNPELLRQKMQVLGEAVETTEKRLKTLKDAKEQVDQQFATGKIEASTYRAFQR